MNDTIIDTIKNLLHTQIAITDTISIDKCNTDLSQHVQLVDKHLSMSDYFWNIPVEIAQFLVPALISFIIFGLGLFFDKLIKQKRKKNEIKSLKQTFDIFISESKKNVMYQIKSIRKFTYALQTSTSLDPPPLDINIIGIERLEEFNIKELVQSFVINQKCESEESKKILYTIIEKITYLSNVSEIIKENYKEYRRISIELMKDWYQEKENFSQMFNSFFLNYAKKDSKLANNCNSIFNNINIYQASPRDYVEKVYKPFFNMLDSYINKETIIEIINMKNTTYKLIETYRNKNKLFIMNKNWFNGYALDIINAYKVLRKNYKMLNDMDIVKFCRIKLMG
jgi:hypothetical protein